MSYLRTAILLAGLMALFMGVGYLLGGSGGALVAFFIAAMTNFFAYWNGDQLVLSMHGAREVDERTAPDLVHIVAELASRAGLSMPRVYLMDNPQPNAFATRTQSGSCRCRSDDWAVEHSLARRSGGGDFPRARTHQESRHAAHDGHCDHCRRHLDVGAVRNVFRRRPPRQQ